MKRKVRWIESFINPIVHMVLSDKISNQSVNAVTQGPQAPEPPTKLKNTP
ncbi:hypothetical protein RO3G_12870 [Rhizopus delemar RA 99-880]|uniref:Uncharacterized protein n=1 Tax=Rhizopus delemar (strain RA 99-880 / ATCC MYA-4621 / FGSC 9543 / NRRL 43880) TaxID=246409 RepID=I1CI79_RHIO9|nr:hypothetical protein RO3G_12870 [Rhizopus delemar RA 99-880]|eukprot:EIE88159.1 hypothetical protein RO3G_12870 [Rhizopus delemar RA 99-880]